jgi:hypothetical protein
MCIQRHSASKPRRLPFVRINFARRQPYGEKIIKSPAVIEVFRLNGVDVWTQEIAANENELLKRVGLWRRVCSRLVQKVARARHFAATQQSVAWE